MKRLLKFALVATVALALGGCPKKVVTTSVMKSVATLVKTSGLNLDTNCTPTVPNPPDYTAWWNSLPAANHAFPFAGWETWRNTPAGCSQSRIDAYRALVTFNMASVSSLKGLVQTASLVVTTRAMPADAGGAVTAGPFGNPTSVTLMCPSLIGGAGTLQRFGPAAVGTLPNVSMAGELDILPAPTAFPTGQVVYTFPPNMNSPGPVAGATDPTTATASGNGGSVFTTDVTSQVNAALNGGAAAMSWMLTANFEGPLPGTLPITGGSVDCKTSYNMDLQITHF